MATKQTVDEANFHLALSKLRERFPDGVEAVFETSDQGLYGFRLSDVLDADGQSLLTPENNVSEQIAAYLADLDWDGVMGEDEFGHAVVRLSAAR